MPLEFCCAQFPVKTRVSLLHYGVVCVVCDKDLYNADRRYLAQNRLCATLCRDCADKALWRINNLRVSVEPAPYILVLCKNCRGIFKGAPRNPKRSCNNCLKPITRRTSKARKAAVYEFFNTSGETIYIGKTICPENRFISGRTSHKNTKQWFTEISHVRITWYRSEYAALTTEAQLIHASSPKYNLAIPHIHTERKMPSIFTYTAAI